jgi:hypothetical protein
MQYDLNQAKLAGFNAAKDLADAKRWGATDEAMTAHINKHFIAATGRWPNSDELRVALTATRNGIATRLAPGNPKVAKIPAHRTATVPAPTNRQMRPGEDRATAAVKLWRRERGLGSDYGDR